MASGKSVYWSQRLLNMLGGASGTVASPLFLALFTVAPTASSYGTEVGASGSYTSLSVTGNTTNWPSISGATVTLANGVAFTFATATGDWASAANVVAVGLKDSGVNGSGNMYYFGTLTEAKPILNGDTAAFAPGALQIAES